MKPASLIAALVWMSPAGFVALVWCGVMTLLGRYAYAGVRTVQGCSAFVFYVRDDKPCPLRRTFPRRNGFAAGWVVLVRHGLDTFSGRAALVHGLAHVEQSRVLGPFHPASYFVVWLGMKLVCPALDAVYDHPFEVDARRRQKLLGEAMQRGGIT